MTKKQIGKRFLQILIVLFGISFLTFGLTYLSPGDPAEIMLTECGNLPTPELLEQTRHELGLDQPFLVQYGTWLKGVLTGDMGQSYFKNDSVNHIIAGTIGKSALLMLNTVVLAVALSLLFGVIAAVNNGKLADRLISGISVVFQSMPNYWVATILILNVCLPWTIRAT